MLYACRVQTLFCEVGAKDAGFGGEWEISKKSPAVGKLLLDFKYLDAADAGLMVIFLGASYFTAVASRAVFIVDQ